LQLAKRSIYTLRQGPYTSNAHHFEKLKARVEVVEEIGGTIGDDTEMVNGELKEYLAEEGIAETNATDDHKKEA